MAILTFRLTNRSRQTASPPLNSSVRPSMSEWSKIAYRGFWDVPRTVIAQRDGSLYLFDSRFDENLDTYLEHYEVWRLPLLPDEQLAKSWVGLQHFALERLPNVGLRDLPFVVSRPNNPASNSAPSK